MTKQLGKTKPQKSRTKTKSNNKTGIMILNKQNVKFMNYMACKKWHIFFLDGKYLSDMINV